MGDSINHSSIHNAVVPSKETSTDSPEEESGWTTYFEDFSANNREDSFSSGFDRSSMVSDAASFPAWKSSRSDCARTCCPTGVSPHPPKKLNFKKTRAKEICHDDSLEDTASSPVSSPKVKGETVNHYGGLMKTDEGRDFSEKKDYAGLKKRGLCLVPFSMFVNYLR